MKKRLLATLMATMMALQPTVAKAETIINMGTFRITYYCSCSRCSDDYGRVTATTHKTGRLAEAGRTVAVDPSVINLGDKLKVGDAEFGIENAHDYVAEDTGFAVKGEVLDVYVDSHEDIPEHGVDYLNVWIVR